MGAQARGSDERGDGPAVPDGPPPTSDPAAVDELMRLGLQLRRDIAARLHDGPVQVLTAAALRLAILPLQDGPPSADDLAEISGLVNESLGAVRAVMDELRPPTDVADTLGAGLRRLAARRGLESRVEVVETGPPVHESVAALYSLVVQRTFDAVPADRLERGVRIDVERSGATERLRIEIDADDLVPHLGSWVSALGGTVHQHVVEGRRVLVVETPSPR